MNSGPPKKLKALTSAKNAIFLILSGVLALLGYALPVQANPLQDQVDSALSAFVQTMAPSTASQRNLGSWQKLDSRLNLPACTQALDVAPFSGKSTGRTTVKVSCQTPAWSLLVPVNVRNFQQVVVSKSPVVRNEAVTANVLALEEREIKPPLSNFFTDIAQVAGRLAKRAIAADQIITASMLKSPSIISKGQSVIIEAASGSFAIRTAGTALTDGGLGDTIRVRNAQSGRVVEGTVVSEGKIRVAL